MLTVKEAAERLTSSGIEASEQDVLHWIEAGQLCAEMSQRRNLTYTINQKDLTDFIVHKHTDEISAQLIRAKLDNNQLAQQLDLLKTRLHIEQSKVRTLKKMLNSQIEAAGTSTTHMEDLLGLSQNSSNQELKKEFKKLLKALHPDRGGDERLFKVFNEHYENLK
ncbi:DnaJ domain-containing protein [Mesobacillus subterraneus]|uniref:J domain-containing protein n=1 Tax=Mesobacillus subterraneus TaxID=285983 RepID=A0A427TY18_9BACI|nr:DnaJ domain-containing protein [Mesobacillus subterraneus]RSD29045.1 J domain-containing protein [Mesobacillus subterraneus]